MSRRIVRAQDIVVLACLLLLHPRRQLLFLSLSLPYTTLVEGRSSWAYLLLAVFSCLWSRSALFAACSSGSGFTLSLSLFHWFTVMISFFFFFFFLYSFFLFFFLSYKITLIMFITVYTGNFLMGYILTLDIFVISKAHYTRFNKCNPIVIRINK